MFFKIFATALALLSAYGNTNEANHHDFQSLVQYSKADSEEEFSQTGVINCSNKSSTTVEFEFSDSYLRTYGTNPEVERRLRYYINTESNFSNEIGYIEFWYSGPEDRSLKIKPCVEVHLEQWINLQLLINWEFQSDQESLKLSYNNKLDLAEHENKTYKWTWEKESDLFTATKEHSNKLSITAIPMSQEEWDAKSETYHDGYIDGWNEGNDYMAEIAKGDINKLEQEKKILTGVIIGLSLTTLLFLGLFVTEKMTKKDDNK